MKIRILLVFGMALGLMACDRTRSSTGWDYMPDMYYSNAYESYTPNSEFEDGLTMRRPVEGTVPTDMIPFQFEKTDEDRLAAGEAMINPLFADEALLREGEKVYEVFCQSCHGPAGEGQGHLFTSGRYPYPPASLINERVRELMDGEIYHSITVGYGIMGAHGGMIPPEDRWEIILHIRQNLQQ